MQNTVVPSLIRRLSVPIALGAVLVVNALANMLPLNGQTTGEISDRFDVLFMPAGYAFSIWGLIYVGLIVYALFQMVPGRSENPRLAAIIPWFWLSCLANISWLVLWHHELFGWTMVAMLVLLTALIVIYRILWAPGVRLPRLGQALVATPFSIYLGWITVATAVNITVVLDHFAWAGLGIPPEAWAIIVIAVAVILGEGALAERRDLAFPLVIIWALFAVGENQKAGSIVHCAALSGVVLLGIGMLITGIFSWIGKSRD